MKRKDLLPLAILAALSAALSGCVGTNPTSAQDNVRQTVAARLGEPAPWPQSDSTDALARVSSSFLRSPLTAQSATSLALLNNRTVQAGFEEIGISQADLAQASRLPNLVLSGTWRFPNQAPSAADVQYTVVGNFLDLLTLPARKKIAARNLKEAQQAVADQVLSLAADTQTAFYTVQAQMELTRRLGTIAAVDHAAADFAQRQYDAGNITDLSLHEQQASAAQAHLDWMRAQAEVAADREQLNRLLGLQGDDINWTTADELPALPKTDPALDNLETLAVSQRLDLAVARSRVKSFADALRLKKHTRFIPGLALGVDTERTPDGQRVTGPTLDVELPLSDQGQPAVARLAALYRQARDTYAAKEDAVRSEVRQAHDALLAARAAVEFSQGNLLPLRREILGETLRQYNAMGKSVYDLLLAKEREQAAEVGTVAALRDYWIARVALERAVGGRMILHPLSK